MSRFPNPHPQRDQRLPDLAADLGLVFIGHPLFEAACAEVLLTDVRRSRLAPGGRDIALAALPDPVIVHGQNFQENLPVFFRVGRGRHQHAE